MNTVLEKCEKSIHSKDKLQGSIFKLHRKDKRMTLQAIANQTGLTAKKLSDFEKGRTALDNETIIYLYQCLGIEYNYDEKNKSEFNKCFYIFYETLLNYDDNIENVYKNAIEMKKLIQTTSVYPQFLLMQFVYNIFHDDMFFDYETIINSIQTHIQSLDNKQKLIYHDCIALYLMRHKKYDEALQQFELAMEYGDGGANAIVNYHKGLLYLDINNPCKAMMCVLKSKFFFDNNHYVKRSVLSSYKIACIYRYLQCYDEALQIYSYCIPLMKSYCMKDKYETIYENYLWCLILAEKYADVLGAINQLEDECKKNPIFYLFSSYANEKLGNHASAKRSIAKAKKHLMGNTQSSILKTIIDTFYTYLSKNKRQETKLNKLRITLHEARKNNNIELQRFIIDMIIDILDPVLQADVIIEYYKKKLKSYKYQ